jgi:DNA polymerase III alpha subunit
VKAVMFKLRANSTSLRGLEHMEKLAKEKEVVGIYISGHPLDDYKFEMKYFAMLSPKNLEWYVGKSLTLVDYQ